jgi:DNA-binding transcriptional regulator/RsmH inhibitor MraZ
MAQAKEPVVPRAVEAEASYLGRHLRNIDGGRIIIPPEWRTPARVTSFIVSLWPIHTREYVVVVPPARWAAYRRNLDGREMTADQAALIKRWIGVCASERPVDSYGRLLLSEAAITLLGPGKEVNLVGCGETFEIWPVDKLEDALKKPIKPETANIFNSIRL